MTKNEILRVAHSCADQARNILNKYYRKSSTIISKSDSSLVTLADQKAESIIREIILTNFPKHGIIGEEEEAINLNSDYIWILDPIDGTDSYILGRPLFGILIGLFYKGDPILSILEQPFTKERWYAYDNKSTLNGLDIKSSNHKTIQNSKIILSSPFLFEGKEYFIKNIRKQAKIVAWEAEAYSFGLLASGHIDAVIKPMLDTYDYLPLMKLMENSKCSISTPAGVKPSMNYKGDIIAVASQELLDEIIYIYNDC